MSRLIVKNLPKAITDDKLREIFSEKGVITDVQLKYTKAGKFRHFAFVGFQNEEEAKAALDYFDNTFLHSLRIKVEKCTELGDDNKPRSWSKYAPDSTAYKKEHSTPKSEEVTIQTEPKTKKKSKLKSEVEEKLKQHLSDPMFTEFLEAHGQEKILKDLNNEDKTEESSTQKEIDEEPTNKIANANISDFEYLKIKSGKKSEADILDNPGIKTEYHTIVVRGLPYKVKKAMLKEFFKPLKLDSIRLPPKIKGVAYIGFKNKCDAEQCLIKNKSFLNGKRVLLYPMKNEADDLEENNNLNKRNPDWQKQTDSLIHEESIAESGRIFVRNLPFITTEEELQTVFEKYGPVTEVIIPIDKISRQVKGYGLITYLMPEHAVKAYTELDGTIFHGRMMHLLPGKAKINLEDETTDECSSFKKKKMAKLKSEAGLSHNWNSLFLGQNAVADIIAKTYNTTKENVLTGDNAAVRLALGESQIVSDTKIYLENQGVKLDIFNQTVINRSKNVILVKNLPADTTELELKDIFSKYGLVNRVVLPPSGVTGLIEFVQNSEAKTAFRQLAYSKFKHLPLYLEWAPDKVLTDVPQNIHEETFPSYTNKDTEDDIDEPESDTTLFIKNINFNTTEEHITKHFEPCGKIANVTVARKKDPNLPGKFLSMGYGFIQFYRQKSVNEALKTKQLSMLDNHSIELKRSNRTLQSATVAERKQGKSYEESTKILVRNIPFQASIQEVIELFKTFGELKGLRMPKKMVGTGTHRGFAFVEYNSKTEAKAAMESMCQSTHLYGRRLVLEWAQAGENLDEMRKRTADQYQLPGGPKKHCKGVADIQIDEDEIKE
ncbi:probable RNA-binding protein 19 isoform X1 [Acyrthosiphon pisum]|uniref:RRM domain-containing protein n=1 Tax=Acyrthosiphon pisum TaxID=7029 RepID=A0A8R2A8C6_ACYPI|nr:probable RNA-binding protein 19 isoform X1 [Acyrthosiphon pisum]|eukprot:XP_001949363.1 PREDICTED: probable RNA-binding protein 19 isoform X1 [Acyrthosiphon pisum]